MEGTGSVDAAVAVLQRSGSLLGGLRNKSKQEMPCSNVLQPTSSMSEVEFMMYRFKTEPCPKPYTHDWAPCPYYHKHASEKARRRSPLTHAYSAVLCPDMQQYGTCPKGDSCSMSHNVFEYALHPDRYRTKLCTMGPACKRPICFYAHSHKQLRMAGGYGLSAQINQPRQHKSISDAMPASTSDRSAPPAGPATAAPGAAGADGVGGSDGHSGAGYTAAVADGMSGADAGSLPADMADAQRSSKPEGLQVLRVTADQGSSMLAAQQGGISCTKDSTGFGMSWFASSPLAPATPNAAALDVMACQPPPPPPPPHGQQQQQQQQQLVLSGPPPPPPVQQKEQQLQQQGKQLEQDFQQQQQQQQQHPALVHCKPEPVEYRTAPLAVAHQEGYSCQQEHQMQYQPDTPLAPWGTESTIAPAQSDNNLAQMQAQFAGLGVTTATAAIYAAPASVAGSAGGAGAGLESQPGTATAASAGGAASLSWQVPDLAACGQQQQQPMQHLGGQLGVFDAAAGVYAASKGSSTLGVWNMSTASAGGGLGVHAMLGAPQPQQQRVYNQQPYQQQQQQLVNLNLDVSALQQLQHIKQQLQQRKLQQLQQQGMAGASVYGSSSGDGTAHPAAVQQAGEFPPGILLQQVADAASGFGASAGAGNSLQPVMMQRPGQHIYLQQQQQQPSQPQVLLVPSHKGAQAVGMQGMGAPPASMQGLGGVGQGVAMPCNNFGMMLQNGIGSGMFGY